MKVVIQRVLEASVQVEQEIIGEIKNGLLLYVCFETNDSESTIDKAVTKISKLRIFEDENQKMNFDIKQCSYAILSISQFTLSWNGSGGHRPSFEGSMEPNKARLYYSLFNKKLRETGIKVEEGKFGANMEVSSKNDGPVTFFLEF